MARVTVTDCLDHVDNRFQLVLIASKRARQLMLGAEPKVEPGDDKPTVLALREIAEGLIGPSILEEADPILDALNFDEDEYKEKEAEMSTEQLRKLFAEDASDDESADDESAADEKTDDEDSDNAQHGDGEAGDAPRAESSVDKDA